MKKRSLTLGKIICILSGISSGVVLIVGFLFPPHNLLTRQMLPAVLLIFLLILAVVWGIPSSIMRSFTPTPRVWLARLL